jgi:hypothetical protein
MIKAKPDEDKKRLQQIPPKPRKEKGSTEKRNKSWRRKPLHVGDITERLSQSGVTMIAHICWHTHKTNNNIRTTNPYQDNEYMRWSDFCYFVFQWNDNRNKPVWSVKMEYFNVVNVL